MKHIESMHPNQYLVHYYLIKMNLKPEAVAGAEGEARRHK
jgi:hypothetical protein